MGLRRWITNRLIHFLTAPLGHYERRGWNDLHALKRQVRKGDVLLVEGNQRVSVVIKYLTQSSWSHAAVYIGDELVRRGGPMAEEALAAYGEEAHFMIVEALLQGVIASPISKYIDSNIRLCRPYALKAEDQATIMDGAVRTLGWRYDVRNIVDLMRYFLPVSLVPRRFRRTALHFGSGVPTEVICSSHLGQLFHGVGFPISPKVSHPDDFDAAPNGRRRGLLNRLFGHDSDAFTGLFHKRHPTLLTPRDFDLSPYFEIIKFNVITDKRFDYTKIHWAEGHADGLEIEAEAGPTV